MPLKKVCILGGSGFVGSHISSQLSSAGYAIKVLTRRKIQCQHLLVLPNIEIIETDIHDQNKLNLHFADVDVAINLVGILNESGHKGDGFRHAHVDLARKVLNACHHNQVPRLLHMSALNADASRGTSHYLRTKGEAEKAIHAFAGNLQVTSFRPSVIFGNDDSFFNRFAAILKITPFFFPLACANARFAPIYIEDVARCFIQAIDNPATFDQRYDLCGPKIYTLKELVSFTSQQLGKKHRIIALPNFLSWLQALLFEIVPGKPFSLDNYYSLQIDSICKEPAQTLCKTTQSPESIVPWFLGKHTQHRRNDQYRQKSRRAQ